jgi:dihydrofolate reductase
MISMIVAHDLARNIGYQGDMPWGHSMKADLSRFKEMTEGKAVIMGRTTFESIGKPLPNRTNIILSKDAKFASEIRGKKMLGLDPAYNNTTVVSSIEEFFHLTKLSNIGEYFVIGGAQIYKQFMPHADRLYITKIHELFEGDVKFPSIQGAWDMVYSPKLLVEGDKYPSQYITLTRRSI